MAEQYAYNYTTRFCCARYHTLHYSTRELQLSDMHAHGMPTVESLVWPYDCTSGWLNSNCFSSYAPFKVKGVG